MRRNSCHAVQAGPHYKSGLPNHTNHNFTSVNDPLLHVFPDTAAITSSQSRRYVHCSPCAGCGTRANSLASSPCEKHAYLQLHVLSDCTMTMSTTYLTCSPSSWQNAASKAYLRRHMPLSCAALLLCTQSSCHCCAVKGRFKCILALELKILGFLCTRAFARRTHITSSTQQITSA